MSTLYTLGVEVKFTRNGEDCGGLSDCEELVGVTWRLSDLWRISGGYSQEMEEWPWEEYYKE